MRQSHNKRLHADGGEQRSSIKVQWPPLVRLVVESACPKIHGLSDAKTPPFTKSGAFSFVAIFCTAPGAAVFQCLIIGTIKFHCSQNRAIKDGSICFTVLG